MSVIGSVAVFLIIFLSGYRLSRSGKPYSVLVLTIHKLISLAAFVLLVVMVIRANRAAALGALELVIGSLTGLFFLSLIVTGGLLSSENAMPAFVLKLHQIAPYLTLLSTAVTLYLLMMRG